VPITELDMDTTLETKTFRGRTLDELLPQIRAELGPDAVVLRRREGLAGGVGGFFQRSYVEVDARAAQPDDDDPTLEARNDRATAEGLASPAIQALVEQASPFADALSSAHDVLAEAAADPGLYGPQPNRAAIEAVAHEFEEIDAPPAEAVAASEAPRVAGAAEDRLVAAGLSPALARDVVAETVAHGLPFARSRRLKPLIRTALARRVPVMGDLGGGSRTLAFVGPGGAGKTAAAEQLATAYARVGTDVAVVALGNGEDAAQAAKRLKRRRPGLTIVDAPAAGPADPAATARLADDLRTLGVDEVHLALPATTGAAAAAELSRSLAPLGITHIALTHADQTAHPGAAVELSVTTRRALSYVCTREAIAPADPDALAKQLLP
jgi:flagellar biosynthesis GTPase FlhF